MIIVCLKTDVLFIVYGRLYLRFFICKFVLWPESMYSALCCCEMIMIISVILSANFENVRIMFHVYSYNTIVIGAYVYAKLVFNLMIIYILVPCVSYICLKIIFLQVSFAICLFNYVPRSVDVN